ncbi:TPA: hypothetical protein DCL28_02155 [Candidatus Komeilibacteria bacterium]|nr:hypothetical protein [Candidatus Komeilibacteria bacterium]
MANISLFYNIYLSLKIYQHILIRKIWVKKISPDHAVSSAFTRSCLMAARQQARFLRWQALLSNRVHPATQNKK